MHNRRDCTCGTTASASPRRYDGAMSATLTPSSVTCATWPGVDTWKVCVVTAAAAAAPRHVSARTARIEAQRASTYLTKETTGGQGPVLTRPGRHGTRRAVRGHAPQPDGPTSATRSPSPICRSVPSSTGSSARLGYAKCTPDQRSSPRHELKIRGRTVSRPSSPSPCVRAGCAVGSRRFFRRIPRAGPSSSSAITRSDAPVARTSSVYVVARLPTWKPRKSEYLPRGRRRDDGAAGGGGYLGEVSAISAGAHMRNAERSPYERAPEMTCDPPTAITVSSDPCIAHETLASTTALSVPTCTACVHASPTAVA